MTNNRAESCTWMPHSPLITQPSHGCLNCLNVEFIDLAPCRWYQKTNICCWTLVYICFAFRLHIAVFIFYDDEIVRKSIPNTLPIYEKSWVRTTCSPFTVSQCRKYQSSPRLQAKHTTICFCKD